MGYYKAVNMNELYHYTTTRVNIKNIILRKRSKSPKLNAYKTQKQ